MKEQLMSLILQFVNQSYLIINLLIEVKNNRRESRNRQVEQFQAENMLDSFSWLFSTLNATFEIVYS